MAATLLELFDKSVESGLATLEPVHFSAPSCQSSSFHVVSAQDQATGNITVINSSRIRTPTGELNTISG